MYEKQKARSSSFGPFFGQPYTAGSPEHKFKSIYFFFRLFARPEVWILYFSKKFDVSAVDRYFMCVGAVGGGRSIAVIYAVGSLNKRRNEKLRGAIGKRKKGVKPTAREKKDGG